MPPDPYHHVVRDPHRLSGSKSLVPDTQVLFGVHGLLGLLGPLGLLGRRLRRTLVGGTPGVGGGVRSPVPSGDSEVLESIEWDPRGGVIGDGLAVE